MCYAIATIIRTVHPLITADALLGRQESAAPPVILDVRWELGMPSQRAEYERGHIPGAAFVDLDTELAGPPGAGGRHPLPAAEVFEDAMRRAGVSGARPVVVYDAGNSVSTARAWWLLRYFGHDEVAVLDGGLAAWVASGSELESGAGSLREGDFSVRPGGTPLIDARGAAELARTGVLLDARAPERFRGESEPIDPVAGHIPGATNRPATDNVAATGRFRPATELREEFVRLGVRDGVAIGAYCGSGVTAAQEVLALELAGFPGAALYAGSWSDWILDPDRPIALGE